MSQWALQGGMMTPVAGDARPGVGVPAMMAMLGAPPAAMPTTPNAAVGAGEARAIRAGRRATGTGADRVGMAATRATSAGDRREGAEEWAEEGAACRGSMSGAGRRGDRAAIRAIRVGISMLARRIAGGQPAGCATTRGNRRAGERG
jgi:hypothetical protein